MTNTLFLIQKLKKEDEMYRLQLEILEMDSQVTGKLNIKKYNQIKKIRGEKCYERAVLEQQLKKELDSLLEENIA